MAASGTQTSTVSTGTLNGVRVGYDNRTTQGQENSTVAKHSLRNGSGPRPIAGGSSRSPLSNVAPNKKGFSDHNSYSKRTQNRAETPNRLNGNVSKSGNEPSDVLDHHRQDNNPGSVGIYGLDNDIPENMYKPEEINPEGWIHRDKLAKIENEELQAAGMQLAHARRSQTNPIKRETGKTNRNDNAGPDEQHQAGREERKSRLSEPAVEEEDDRATWDLRNPEEIAAEEAGQTEQTATQVYAHPVIRKTGSKIPVLASSPVSTTSPVLPVPDKAEQETLVSRKRTLSNSTSPEQARPASKARNRGNSATSPAPRDETKLMKTPTPEEGTSAVLKTSTPNKPTSQITPGSPPGSATLATKSTPRPRNTSVTIKPTQASSPSPRPTTKPTDMDRPRTALNRPEGDPPWLATMYKTDPMLPPDQQIIPTHARRQQQAQWEEQGAIPTTYDRNFSPLAVHSSRETPKPSTPPPPPRQATPSSEKPGETSPWPLKPVISTRSSNTGRPGTGSSNTGGYSTMPKVTSPVINPSPRIGTIGTPRIDGKSVQVPARMQVQRPPEDEKDEGTVKKGCACCTVM